MLGTGARTTGTVASVLTGSPSAGTAGGATHGAAFAMVGTTVGLYTGSEA